MKVLASLSILLALLAVSQATAETRSITIGKFTYLGTGTQTRSDGTVIQGVSSYELVFDTGGVTAEPIPFSNAILFVKGSRQGTQSSGFPTITTGNGCGQNDSFPPCDLIFEGGPSSAGFRLAPCALQDNARGYLLGPMILATAPWIGCGGGTGSSRSSSAGSNTQGNLTIGANSLDFGSVSVGPRKTNSLVLNNGMTGGSISP